MQNRCDLPNPPTIYTAEGTVAHDLAAKRLTGKLTKTSILEEIGKVVMQDGFEIKIDEEMVDGAELYCDVVMADLAAMNKAPGAKTVEIFIEQKLVLTSVHEGAWGTGDAGLASKGRCLKVYDYKYGKGKVVEVKNNAQMMFYGIGYLDLINCRAFDEVELTIVQPRAPHSDGRVRRWKTTVKELDTFGGRIKSAIEESEREDARICAGDWCGFCPARGIPCEALAGRAMEVAKADFSVLPDPLAVASLPEVVAAMPMEAAVRALAWEDTFNAMFEGIRNRITDELNRGEKVPGMKLVESRSFRQWSSEDAVKKEFEPLLGSAIYKERELMSPAQLEKKVGKEMVAKLTYKPTGKKTLAPESDPRPSVVTNAADQFTALPGPETPPPPKTVAELLDL